MSSYTISALSKEFGVTLRALRFYEDQGLLNPKRQGKNRLYSKRDRVRLKLALRGKRLGFSLAEIKQLFDLYDAAHDESAQLSEFLLMLSKHRADLERKREDLEAMLQEIQVFEKLCRDLLNGRGARRV
ncbi:MAG: MerR family transcriptional regulator, partial [Burkholderiales bacterium]